MHFQPAEHSASQGRDTATCEGHATLSKTGSGDGFGPVSEAPAHSSIVHFDHSPRSWRLLQHTNPAQMSA